MFHIFLVSSITSDKLCMLLISLIILYIVSLISNWIYNHFYENFVWSVQYSLRNYCFMKLLKLDPKNMSRYHIAYIQRTDVVLFDLSIKDNLTLGKNISVEKIMTLIEAARLMEWFNNLENGLDGKVD